MIRPLPNNKSGRSRLWRCAASSHDDADNRKNFTGSRLLMAIHLVGNYGGLVLLKGMVVDPVHESSKPTPSGYPTYFYYYYLCNPITKHWVELPFIQTSNDRVGFTCYYLAEAQGEGENDTTTTTSTTRIWADVSSYDKDNNDNYDPNKIEFTVISMHPHEKDGVFVIKLLSSADEVSGWNIFRVPFPPGWTSISFGRKILFMNGKFHWCGENSIVAYDPFCKPLECDDVIPFPPMDTFDFLSLEAFEGCLRLVTSFLAKTLVVWDLVDYGNKAWVKKVDINYNNNSSSDEHLLKFQSFVGGTGTGTARDKVYMLDISLVLDNSSTITLYDLKNESHQLVYDPSILDNAKKLLLVEPFISSPWPTPVPQLKTGNK